MDMRNITTETIARITKENDAKTKQMICKIKDPKYVAPENDKWRHDNSDSDNEDAKRWKKKENTKVGLLENRNKDWSMKLFWSHLQLLSKELIF
ncbi:hypothetical protein Hanom_Chr04g00304081 [Helianthus anomalus]